MKRRGILLLFFFAICLSGFAQLVGINSSAKLLTSYANTNANDTIYMYCQKDVNGLATLIAKPVGGIPPFTFDWQKYDTLSYKYVHFMNDSGLYSSVDSLGSGGYSVMVKDSLGVVQCPIRCWVFIENLSVQVDSIVPKFDIIQLNALVKGSTFTYYDPPFIVDAQTSITVCFDATHSYVSDLGFHLVGPINCGSPDIDFWTPNGATCNGGNDVNGLCFTTTSPNPFNTCIPAAWHTLSGTFASGSPWSPLYGCASTDYGWAVQIYDCVAGDIGVLTHATLTMSNNTACGSFYVQYDSGIISEAINDSACALQSASKYTFQIPNFISHTVTCPLSFNWVANPPVANPWNLPTQQATITAPMPLQDCWFIVTATDAQSGCSAKDSAKYWYSLAGIENNNTETFFLNQNTPNPFSEKTVISYSIPVNTKDAQLVIYDNRGNMVKSLVLTQKGKGQITVYGNNLRSGLYTYKIVVDGKVSKTRKMVCVK